MASDPDGPSDLDDIDSLDRQRDLTAEQIAAQDRALRERLKNMTPQERAEFLGKPVEEVSGTARSTASFSSLSPIAQQRAAFVAQQSRELHLSEMDEAARGPALKPVWEEAHRRFPDPDRELVAGETTGPRRPEPVLRRTLEEERQALGDRADSADFRRLETKVRALGAAVKPGMSSEEAKAAAVAALRAISGNAEPVDGADPLAV